MTRKNQLVEYRHPLLDMAECFLPLGSQLLNAEILPKTTLELRWVSPSSRRINWLIISYKLNNSFFRTKIAIS